MALNNAWKFALDITHFECRTIDRSKTNSCRATSEPRHDKQINFARQKKTPNITGGTCLARLNKLRWESAVLRFSTIKPMFNVVQSVAVSALLNRI